MAGPENGQSTALTRGALAAHTGCNIETIRYYEQIGMLPPIPRSEGGHRLYDPDLVKRLSFIRRSRDLGFTLDEIRALLRLVDGGKYTCEQVERLAIEHVQEVDRKISDLRRLKRVLQAMISQCSGGDVPHCPIIDTLYHPHNFPLVGGPVGQGKRHPQKSPP